MNHIFFAISIVVAAAILALGAQNLRQSERVVTVKGSAELHVQADVAAWPLTFNVAGDDLTAVQAQVVRAEREIIDYLKKFDLTDTDIEVQPLRVQDATTNQYNRNFTSRYVIEGGVLVRTTDIQKVQQAARNTADLVREGVILTNYGGPRYSFTKLNDVKPALIAEATRNARKSAEQFAEDSGAKVGAIRYANQGYVQILGRDDHKSADEQAHKRIRVVTTIEYLLK